MIRKLPILYLLLISSFVQAQVRISGHITDHKGIPLPAASVFLAGTSFGTVAGDSGKFILPPLPAGRYDLVVSFAGFQTQSQTIDARTSTVINLPVIQLLPATSELETVVVSSYEKSDWETWGKFFLEQAFGTVPEAVDCKLKNHKDLEFRHYKKQGILKAFAKKPLIIENRALGYDLQYQLEQYEYNFKTRILLITGYPLFIEKSTKNQRQQKRWETARANAYFGSQLHFMRALFGNQLAQEGFEIRKLVKKPNTEKERIKTMMKTTLKEGSITISTKGDFISENASPDSARYYRKVLQQPDAIDVLYNTILPADSIAYFINALTAGVYFEDHLHITYTKGMEQKAWLDLPEQGGRAAANPVSMLLLPHNNAIEIDQSGAFFAPADLLVMGYWAWSQRISTMLPFNYQPPALNPSVK